MGLVNSSPSANAATLTTNEELRLREELAPLPPSSSSSSLLNERGRSHASHPVVAAVSSADGISKISKSQRLELANNVTICAAGDGNGRLSANDANLTTNQELPSREKLVPLRPSPSSFSLLNERGEFHASYPIIANTVSADDIPKESKRRRLELERNAKICVVDDGALSRSSDSTSATPTSVPHLLSAGLGTILLSKMIDLRSVKQLQLSCSSVCADCREWTGFHVRVVTRTPRRLWTDASASTGRRRRERAAAGIPGLPPVRTERLTFGDHFDRALNNVVWPTTLSHITFGKSFNKSLNGVRWPATLAHVRFGSRFNQPLVEMIWPPCLQTIAFGRDFDSSLDGVRWPPCVRNIVFGTNFNQTLIGIDWPRGLTRLHMGWAFNKPVEGVVWPEGLQHITFSHMFDQPIDAALFPSTLQALELGVMFDQDVSGVTWPASLKWLSFGCQFNHTLEHTRFPQGLEGLELGCSWNHPIAPVELPDNLTSLRLGYDFDQPLDDVSWPRRLSQLSIDDSFNQPLAGVKWSPSLTSIEIGDAFDQSLRGVQWPIGLKKAVFGTRMDIDRERSATWPPSLVELKFGATALKGTL